MLSNSVARHLLAVFVAGWMAVALPPDARAQTAAAAKRGASAPAKKPPATSTRTVEAVLLSWEKETKAVRLQPIEGGAGPIIAILDADCRFVSGGRAVEGMADFSQGQRVVARLTARAAFGGTVFLRTLWDAPSYAAEKERRTGICVGTVEAVTIGSIDVRRAVDEEVIAFRLSEKTLVFKNDAPAPFEAYPVGAAVAVKPRALPSGGLMASIIATSDAEVERAHLDTLTAWQGELLSIQPNIGNEPALLGIRRSDGALRKLYVSSSAAVKVAGKTITADRLPIGADLRLHLIKGQWKDGMRVADEVSVPKRRTKKGTSRTP